MIKFVKGRLVHKDSSYIIVENQGIGYLIFTYSNSIFFLKHIGEDIQVFTSMIVREDDISLYGFESMDELDLFNKLIQVNGVGAKAGLSIFSALSEMEIKQAIYTEDTQTLTKANGIGKKTAQRIVIDLKDKINISEININTTYKKVEKSNEKEDAILVLTGMGFSKSDISKVIDDLEENLKAEDYIKLALKDLGK